MLGKKDNAGRLTNSFKEKLENHPKSQKRGGGEGNQYSPSAILQKPGNAPQFSLASPASNPSFKSERFTKRQKSSPGGKKGGKHNKKKELQIPYIHIPRCGSDAGLASHKSQVKLYNVRIPKKSWPSTWGGGGLGAGGSGVSPGQLPPVCARLSEHYQPPPTTLCTWPQNPSVHTANFHLHSCSKIPVSVWNPRLLPTPTPQEGKQD